MLYGGSSVSRGYSDQCSSLMRVIPTNCLPVALSNPESFSVSLHQLPSLSNQLPWRVSEIFICHQSRGSIKFVGVNLGQDRCEIMRNVFFVPQFLSSISAVHCEYFPITIPSHNLSRLGYDSSSQIASCLRARCRNIYATIVSGIRKVISKENPVSS
jgi:hypothetical protein